MQASENVDSGEVVISLKNISKDFVLTHNPRRSYRELLSFKKREHKPHREVFNVLRNINFEAKAGEAIALTGKNGCGKSTMLQVIAGILKPDTGSVVTRGVVAPMIRLGVGFHPELTGEENIYLNASLFGIRNEETRERLHEIAEFSGIGKFIDVPLKRYSSGMLIRLGFSVAVHMNPNIILADEILAVGDESFKEKCLQKMQELTGRGITLVFVSHSPRLVDQFCNRFLRLHDGVITEHETAKALFSQSP